MGRQRFFLAEGVFLECVSGLGQLGHNFGFYTVILDRHFGKLFPRYDETFGAALEVPAATESPGRPNEPA
jgi:hypothetical protein